MRIRLAGMTVDIHPQYRYVAEICRPYLAPEGAEADFSVTVTEEDLRYEAARDAVALREAAGTEANSARAAATRDVLESAAIYRKICHEALNHDAFLFHGSALSLDGEGYLFTAPSGTGKSTHAALWRAAFGDRVKMVNDDKPLLRVGTEGVTVSGTPWDGKHHISTPGDFPLRAICLLERGRENRIKRLTTEEAYPCLLGQTYRPHEAEMMMRTLTLLDRVLQRVAVYRLTCNMDPEAALVACRGMGGKI